MATRSMIAIRREDGYHSVYCHWDGYPEHNGVILDEFYRDAQLVEQLIQQGDISSLGAQIGEQHDFDQSNEYQQIRGTHVAAQCTFYHRDRGEPKRASVRSATFAQFLDRVQGSTAEFYYVMQDGAWYCGAVYHSQGVEKNGLVPLSDTLASIRAMEDA